MSDIKAVIEEVQLNAPILQEQIDVVLQNGDIADIIATIEEVQINAPVVEEQIDVTLQGAIIEEFENPLIVNAGQNIIVTDTGFSEIEVATVDDPDFTGIKLDTVNPITISTAGQLAWNDVDGTVDIGLKNNVKLKTGQQLYFYGKAQGTITKRDVVQFAGFEGDHILIKKAVGAEIEAFPEGLIGVAKQSLTNGQFGYVTWFGEVAEVSTTGWAVGDILYFDNVTGGLTNVAPLAPNRKIVIAAVEKLATGMAQNGVLLVRPTFGLKLKELDDVNGTALTTTGQIPSYNASTGYFDFTENINNKQNTLVSGTNIKTIKGQSLLGSGNIDLGSLDIGFPIIEIPNGVINGINNSYTVDFSWIPETVIVYRNGQKIHLSQVTLTTSSSFTLEDPPLTGDLIEVQYNKLI